MPKGRSQLTVPTVSGVRADIGALHDRFVAHDSLEYDHFKRIWKRMKFDNIFAHVQSYAALREVGSVRAHMHTSQVTFTALHVALGFATASSACENGR
jgi:hypothetical protein